MTTNAFKRALLSVCFAASLGVLVFAQEFTAKGVAVADGDTITVLRDGFEQVKLRIEGVDCPESGQEGAEIATRLTSALVLDRLLTVRVKESDGYERKVSRVSVDGLDVSTVLVVSGACRFLEKYSDDPLLPRAEEIARQAGLGLWARQSQPPPSQPRPYHGNRHSKVFHAASCRYYNCGNCTVMLQSKEQALREGFRPHQECIEAKP